MPHSVLDQAKFWEVVKYLVQLESEKSFDVICEDLDIHKHQLKAFIIFLKEVSYDMEFSAGEELIIPPEDKPRINLEFNLLEWLQFQAHFPALSSQKGKPYFEDFKNKLFEVEHEFSDYDLFSSLDEVDLNEAVPNLSIVRPQTVGDDFQTFISEAIEDSQVIRVKHGEKSFTLYPHNLIHLEGKLTLIAESLADKCLMAIQLSEVEQVFEFEKEYTPQFGLFDVQEFIQKMRSIGEGEERLILKILDAKKFKTETTNEFFMNPCLVMTPRGESIWAATVEKSPMLFDWLYEMSPFVEIIDPIGLKKEFLEYCQKKYKRHA